MCYYTVNFIPKDRGAVVKSSLCVRFASVAQIKGAAAEEKRGVRFSGHGENISVAVAKAESYYGSFNLAGYCCGPFDLQLLAIRPVAVFYLSCGAE